MAVKSKTALGREEHTPGKPKKTRQGMGQHSKRKRANSRKLLRGQGRGCFNHHELKLIFTAIRRYQTSQIEEPNGFGLYVELQSILDRLQPSAYSETYLEAADGQKDA